MASSAPPNGNPANATAGLDIDTFRKLVARFDSSYPAEAETAFRKTIMLCAQAQTRFVDAATAAYGQNGNAAQLQAEVADLKQKLDLREKQGAALADARDRLEREFAGYRAKAEVAARTHKSEAATLQREIALLQSSAGQVNAYCRACETKRRMLALIGAGLVGWAWFAHREWFEGVGLHDTGEWHGVHGVLLAAIPLLLILVHWRWLRFKRRNAWVTWRDNDVYRLIAERWNGFLQRVQMR